MKDKKRSLGDEEHTLEGEEMVVKSSFQMGEFSNVGKFISEISQILTESMHLLLFATIEGLSGNDKHTLLFLKMHDAKFHALGKMTTKGSYVLIDLHKYNSYNVRAKFKDFGFVNYSLSESIDYSREDHATISALFGLIENECSRATSEFSHRIIYSYLEILLTVTLRAYTTFFRERRDATREVDTKFSMLCEDVSMNRSVTNPELPSMDNFAGKLGFTKYYLNDLSKALYGRTAQDRIEEQIIVQAKKLLADTDGSVAEIAYQIGFTEPQMLNRLFKKRTGKTPLEYRISLV
ncbi:helix-turn-helix domain-containing protein [Sphingobacterium deserti]|uniref:AraC family transcriptional regulator n=1 Tax=Sphingobacterium deserti TaxID=1229276 RepID=A0A0B8T1P8_9SPHI|nr:helix-turn-helix transcriptional regulator [Sphingobacterium deserti]KGE12598.1 AraC family transcriptional regulator [Sphingobacterium deserti]